MSNVRRGEQARVDVRIYEKSEFNSMCPLGKGAFGKIWRAQHGLDDVVIKGFQLKRFNQKAFVKEVEKMCKVLCFNQLVHIRGYGFNLDSDALPFIVMDYYKYGSYANFQQFVDEKCWPRLIKIMHDMVSGLHSLHSELQSAIVHRDLTVWNIFIDENFNAKIGDLGVASCVDSSSAYYRNRGTVTNWPPEAISGVDPNAKPPWDIFGLGMVLYQMVTGKYPYENCDTQTALGSIAAGKRPTWDAAVLPRTTPCIIQWIVPKCWHQDPKERPTAAALKAELYEVFKTAYEIHLETTDNYIKDKIKRVTGQ